MSSDAPFDPGGPAWYRIRITGHLDRRWSSWFDDLVLTRDDDGTTVLQGPVADQAALHGLLAKVRDIGMPLVSVTRESDPPGHSSVRPDGRRC